MFPNLLEIICCPVCRQTLAVSQNNRSDGDELTEGSLQCSGCGRSFPVTNGIPNLLPESYDDATATAFSFQWKLCFGGWFEKGTRYGYDIGRLVEWVFNTCFSSVAPHEWLLDAGCGYGDKTIELARRYPQAQVIGIDLASTLHMSRIAAAGLGNIHFVRGDLLRPPVRDGVIAKAMSLGVLHHTPNATQKAFQNVAKMVGPSGELAVWLYPNSFDSDFCDVAYEMRDVHFFSRAHRMPKALLLAILPFYVALTAPYFLLRYGNPLEDPRMVSTRIVANKMSFLARFRSTVFMYLDNLVPEFQDRPKRSDVNQWYAESGFGPVGWNDPGMFYASKAAALSRSQGTDS